jgi:hypothetical protein
MKIYLGLFLSIVFLGIVGCSRPDKITTVASPRPALFYTVETTSGDGPMSSGSTEVYANFRDGSKTRRMLVLRGLYLQISSIKWNSPDDVTMCLAGGITSVFRNQITLNGENTYVTVHNHIDERCNSASTISSNTGR